MVKIERKRIAGMNRATYNPRVSLRPGDDDYEALARSINKFGLVIPIIWNERTNNVVGGHQRLTVLVNQGESEVDVSVVDLDDTREKQLNVALNKISGSWDDEKLVAIFQELGERASETGFSLYEIEALESNVDSMIDGGFLEKELAQLEETFNISLKFSAADKAVLVDYIKENGKDSLVRIIIEKVKGAI